MISATLPNNRRGSFSALSFISFFFALCCILHLSEGANSSFDFPLGSVFTGNRTVLSQNGSFEAGLFSPPGSQFVYLGIWHANLQPRTVVWVANRNQQISGNLSYACTASGGLQVMDASGKVTWSSGTKGRNVSGGVFKDTGNIILLGANESDVVWQSFDHPVNTWLPTMKIGLGKKLVSWKSPSNPAEGRYSLHMTPTTEFVSMWEDQIIYWRTGVWNGHAFSDVPEMSNNTYFAFFFDSSGFSWIILPSENMIVQFIMDIDGLIKHEAWVPSASAWNAFWSQPHGQCDVYELCGPNGVCGDNVTPFCSCPSGFQPTNAQEWLTNSWSNGCSRQTKLGCSNNDGFSALLQTSFNASSPQIVSGLDINGCSSACLKNCSCEAYSYGEVSGECELLSGVLLNGRTSSAIAETTYLRGVSTPSGGRRKWKKSALEAGLVSGLATLLVGACVIYVVAKRRAKSISASTGEAIEMFKYGQLQAATKNFSEKLGSGGFGEVYKGWINGIDGKPIAIAVKQLLKEVSSQQGEKQFRSEMSTIGSIRHVNLVRLRGFCFEKMHRLLVYDYMPNGSLDGYLISGGGASEAGGSAGGDGGSGSVDGGSDNVNGGSAGVDGGSAGVAANLKVLDWPTRYNIAVGAALGLAYLHDGCRQCIIHCDIKPENILLDSDFSAKVADFGLAKLVGREFSRVLTTVRGTRGYLAPEWIAGMPITPKTDVYSFGMTLLELVSGRRNFEQTRTTERGTDPNRRFFPVWAALCIEEKRDLVEELADPRLGGAVDVEQLRRIVFVAIWCIQEHETARPSMRKIVHMLEGSVEVSPPPMLESLRDLVMESDYSLTTDSTSLPSWLDSPYKS